MKTVNKNLEIFYIDNNQLEKKSFRVLKPDREYALISISESEIRSTNRFTYLRSEKGLSFPKGVSSTFIVIAHDLIWFKSNFSPSLAEMWYNLLSSCDYSYEKLESSYGNYHLERFYYLKELVTEQELVAQMELLFKKPILKVV